MMREKRTKSITVSLKVTEAEYAQIEACAAGASVSEWARQTLLDRLAGGDGSDHAEALLTQVLLLRAIVIAAIQPLCQRLAALPRTGPDVPPVVDLRSLVAEIDSPDQIAGLQATARQILGAPARTETTDGPRAPVTQADLWS